ncbi:MAG: alpha/beta hydrolase [Parvibaculum sedimenti]|uniref:alpha/beta fold hydrolase n=1 Tax=Parvibaculum sedimenti TaxID=2608632 RepID=UPI003BB54449
MFEHENVLYFHGLPGSPRELQLFGRIAKDRWYAPDRQALNRGVSLADHFDRLASDIRAGYPDRSIKVVGFSLGAYVALEVASRLPDMSMTIDLVSAAAPLSGKEYLNRMAGKAVFALAAEHPRLFAALTYTQALASRIAPTLLCDALFASAQGEDRGLCDNPMFRQTMASIIADCLAADASNYRREISGYVADWSRVLKTVRHPVTLWHGQMDNWAPPEMAEDLARSLPKVTALHRLTGKSHYSTLRAYQLEAGVW